MSASLVFNQNSIYNRIQGIDLLRRISISFPLSSFLTHVAANKLTLQYNFPFLLQIFLKVLGANIWIPRNHHQLYHMQIDPIKSSLNQSPLVWIAWD